MRAYAGVRTGFVAAIALFAMACGSDERTTASTTPESAAPTVSVAPSTTTSIASSPTTTTITPTDSTPTTRPATTTTPPVEVTDLTLRPDGFGEFGFGAGPDMVISMANEAFGAPGHDMTTDYSVVDGSVFTTDDGLEGFDHPVGRTVCWADLCLQFGGTHGGASFVGWEYRDRLPDEGTTSPTVTNRDGVTIGSRWSDFLDALVIPAGGCYTEGYGHTTDGIAVVVIGGQFSTTTDDGTYVDLLPDPHDVKVRVMSAGALPVYYEHDC